MPRLSVVMLSIPSRARLRAVTIPAALAQIAPLHASVEFVLVLDDDDQLDPAVRDAITTRCTHWRIVYGRWATVGDKQNAGIDAAQGEWITLWDDDDWSSPARLTTTLDALDAHADIIGVARILYHELTGANRRTVAFTTPAHVVDGLVTFRRSLWTRTPFPASRWGDVGMWIVERVRSGAWVTQIDFSYVAMIHGTNATRAQPFRVDPVNGTVWDGPREFRLVGGRDAAAAIMSNAVLTQYESAVA